MATLRSNNRKGLHSFVALVIFILLAAGVIIVLIAGGGRKPAGSSEGQERPAANERTGVEIGAIPPSETPEFKVDPKAVAELQSTEFKFEKSGLKVRLPKNFTISMTRKVRADHDEATFRDTSSPESTEQSAPLIYIQVTHVPDKYWNSAVSSLLMNIDRGAIPAIRQKGIEVTKRGGALEYEINGTKFMRQEADCKIKSGRKDRYVFYCGALKPYLIEVQCCCTPDRLEDLLPVMEASIWSMQR
jgi:hypothetical protein